jgi:hypothetical protein
MLVATEALKPPELRIGKIGENFTLPRTVRVASLVAGGAGGFTGVVFVSVFVGMTLSGVLYGFILGALLGTALISYSPLRGESLGRWAMLRFKARRRRVDRAGRPVRLAVGICYVEPVFEGQVRIVGGAVNVRPGQVDDRFAFVESEGRRLNARQRLGLEQLPGEDDDDDVLARPRRGPRRGAGRGAGRGEGAGVSQRSVRSLSLAGFRAATGEQTEFERRSALSLEDVPESKMSVRRRHGRWTQDREELADLYGLSAAVNAGELDGFVE